MRFENVIYLFPELEGKGSDKFELCWFSARFDKNSIDVESLEMLVRPPLV